MKNVVVDRITKLVKGYDREPQPFELSIEIPYPIQLSKTIEEKTGVLIQKTDADGDSLYKTNVAIDELGVETYDETVVQRLPTKFETQSFPYKIGTDRFTTELQDVLQPDGSTKQEEVQVPVYDEIVNTVEVPIEWLDNEPIMVEEVVSKTYTLEENCSIFTADEVTEVVARTVIPKTEVEINTERITSLEDATNAILTMM